MDRTRFRRTALEEAEHNAALQSMDHFVTFDADLNWLEHNGYRTNRRSKEEISCFLFKALQPMTLPEHFQVFRQRVLSAAYQLTHMIII